MEGRGSGIVMVGAFPPPVHGMAAVNAAVLEQFRNAGAKPLVIDLAAPSLDRSIFARLSRLPKVFRGFGRLAGTCGLRGRALYMSISGGLGQIYEIAFLLLARSRGMRVFLHHHSFAYLDVPSRLTRWLVWSAGEHAVHITQSPKMAERLKDVYGAVCVAPVSNTVFLVSDDTKPRVRQHLETLGFLSNVAPEKGMLEFLDLCAAIRDNGLPLRARLAGPFQDDKTERAVRARLAVLQAVEYVGPKYGAEKDAFYSIIDVLVFPTRYRNETEGIVNHEAMSRGIPIVAYGRGCIPEIIGTDCGLVIDPAAPFVPAALAQIEAWASDPSAFEAASKAAAQRFAKTNAENSERWTDLLADIMGAN